VVPVTIAFALLLLAGTSESFDSAYRAGLIALGQNKLAEAESNLETAAKLAPSNARVWAALAETLAKLGKTSDADRAAAKAESLGSGDALAAHALAIYYSQTSRPLKAAQLESKYASANPSDTAAKQRIAEWYFAAAEPLLKQQRFADALGILEPAHTQVPEDAQIQLALGVAYYGLRRFEEAAVQFLRTIDLAPEERQPYVFLGRMIDQAPAALKDAGPRFAAYRKAHPDDELGYLLEARNAEPQQARELLQKAIQLAPNDAAAHLELGVLEERTQRFSEAAAELERAAALDVSDPVAHYHLARVYDRLGRPERARAERETHAKLIAAQETVR
jgi:Flp pilus assembly protein TadD